MIFTPHVARAYLSLWPQATSGQRTPIFPVIFRHPVHRIGFDNTQFRRVYPRAVAVSPGTAIIADHAVPDEHGWPRFKSRLAARSVSSLPSSCTFAQLLHRRIEDPATIEFLDKSTSHVQR